VDRNIPAERVLYSYFRSSASYRVRIALNLKQLDFDYVAVHLNRDGGEQFRPAFQTLNPQSHVPVLQQGDTTVSQSLAIIEYLDERYPRWPLLPGSAEDRAVVRQLALTVACDIHPLNNLKVLKFLTGELQLSEQDKLLWIKHWLCLGLSALESSLARASTRGRFCFQDAPTMADCCLVPQLYNAQRFNVDLSAYPTLVAIDQACQSLAAFQLAHPSRQPDAEPGA
jgi:maleylpyruvate isomerase